MVSGKDKAVALMAALGDKSDLVMAHLEEAEVGILKEGLQDRPESSSGALELALSEAVQFLELDVVEEPQVELNLETFDTDVSDSAEEALDWDNESTSDDLGFGSGLSDEYEDPAEKLKEQSDQMIAFFLSKINEDQKKGILGHFSQEDKDRILSIEVDDMPAASFIFEKMHKSIFSD